MPVMPKPVELSLERSVEKSDEKSVSQHYSKSAHEFEKAWFYRDDSPYQDFLVEKHLECLDLQAGDASIADVGAGSCNFSAKLGKAAGKSVLCIEPSPTLLQPDVSKDGCAKVLMGGEDYFKGMPEGVTKVIVKEAIHHFPEGPVFNDMCRTLRQNGGGRVVIMTRAQDYCDRFPFFARAREEWSNGRPHHSVYVRNLLACGFDEVDIRTCTFQVRMNMGEWHQMVRSRFWSCFRSLSDQEIEEGLAELEEEYGFREECHFADKIVFLVATVLSDENLVKRKRWE